MKQEKWVLFSLTHASFIFQPIKWDLTQKSWRWRRFSLFFVKSDVLNNNLSIFVSLQVLFIIHLQKKTIEFIVAVCELCLQYYFSADEETLKFEQTLENKTILRGRDFSFECRVKCNECRISFVWRKNGQVNISTNWRQFEI